MRVQASSLRGTLSVPSSKSQTMRALVFALMAQGKSVIHCYLHSPDVQAMILACRKLGAQIHQTSQTLTVIGRIKKAEDVIDCGNSGQVLRFIGALSSLASSYTVLTGDESIRHRRPVKPLLDGLNQLGAFAVSSRGDDYAPIIIRGPLQGGYALIDGKDSQPVSGLLMAAAFAPSKTELFVTDPGEQPWVGLTLSWFDRLGLKYDNHSFERYVIQGQEKIEGFEYIVPADWSSVAYPIVAALITNSELTIEGVDYTDAQGDKEVIGVLQEMGAKISIEGSKITVHPGPRLKGTKIDVGRFIDAITLLPVVACFAEGKTEIIGGKIAREKECNRIYAIATELKKMGAKIEEHEDGLTIESSPLHGALLESYADHRMAMSLTVAGLAAQGESEIRGTEAVAKSFPGFFELFRKAGAKIQ